MRIAFYSYPSAFQDPGGGEVQLLKTKEALQKQGIEVKLFEQWNDKMENFDILHVFGSVKDCAGLMQTAKNRGLKIALSTIFYSSIKRALHESDRFGRKLDLTLRHATKVIFPNFPSGRRKTMQLADILLPNGQTEAIQVKRLFAMPKDKISVVPNGVDIRFKDADKSLFSQRYKFKDFALAVGRIEPRKNQLNLIKAFKGIKKDLVVVGDPISDYTEYYQECKNSAGSNIHFIGRLGHEDGMLASAYASCKVFVAPGWFETPGLAALEAGLSGSSIAITRYGCTEEYFKDMADYFDPSSLSSISKAILAAYDRARNIELKEYIGNNYTWDKVADATIVAYEKILGGK